MRLALFSFVVAALSVQQAVSIPFDKRAASTNDTEILQVALTLEFLEVAFYTRGLQLFSESDFLDADYTPLVFRRFVEILDHEKEHVKILTNALGNQAPNACNYSFPITDVHSFVHLSQLFEDVGGAAYTGAIPYLSSQENSAVSASILATEVRQAAWLAASVNNGAPWGSAFQNSLTLRQAFSAASTFITSCPSDNPDLGLIAFPALNITGSFPEQAFPGENATVQYAPSSSVTATHIAFVFALTPIFVAIENGNVLVPENLSGQVYAIATSSATELSDSTTVAGPAPMLFERFSNGSLTN